MRTHFIALWLCACTPQAAKTIVDVLNAAAQGAQTIGSIVDVARGGADAYFDRYPNPDNQYKVAAAFREVDAALAAYNEAVTFGRNLAEYRERVLHQLEVVRGLLRSMGVLDGIPPTGGAETEAPDVKPIPFPAPEILAEVVK